MPNLRIPQNWQSPSDVNSLITFHASTAIEGLCTCAYMVSAIGNIVVGVTDWGSNLTSVPGYPGVTFKSTIGMRASRLEQPSGVDPANIEIDVFISSAALSEVDISSGKWDHGTCRIFTTNALALHMGQIIEADGFFSEFKKLGSIYTTELRGKNEATRQVIGRVTEPTCDADHGDARCKRDLVALGEVHTVALTTVTSQSVFRASSLTQGDDYFTNAKGRFTTGQNTGFEFVVDTWTPGTKEFKLRQQMPFLPVNGDTIEVKRGCRKRKADCIERENIINMRAFADIPTIEAFTRLPNIA